MTCPVLAQLAHTVADVRDLPLPTGLGADLVLDEQTAALAAAIAALQREYSHRSVARERHGGPPADTRGQAVRAGLPAAQASRLRQLGVFAADHPELQARWLNGDVRQDHLQVLRDTAVRLPTPKLREELVTLLLPHLADLDAAQLRRLANHLADQLDPGDPDNDELTDHAARHLDWSATPRGGITFQGFLPAAEADALTAAINALAEDLRTAGDGLTPGQRRADGLAALVNRAAPPTRGGLPATMTLTVSLDEAARVALRDPCTFGNHYESRPASASTIGRNGTPAGDAVTRFGLCAAAITPTLHDTPAPTGLMERIANDPIQPLAVGRSVRLATSAQRTALNQRDRGCAIPDCNVPAPHTQPHHVTPWSLDGPTDLDNLISLCFVHHRQVELGRYTLIRRDPDQPRPLGALEHAIWWIVPPRLGFTD